MEAAFKGLAGIITGHHGDIAGHRIGVEMGFVAPAQVFLSNPICHPN
jgi:hypothetical protein